MLDTTEADRKQMTHTIKSRTWCRIADGRVPAAGVLFYRRDPTSGRLMLAMLMYSAKPGGPPKYDVFGGKCELADNGLAGTLKREFAEEMYYLRDVPFAYFSQQLDAACRTYPVATQTPGAARPAPSDSELVLLLHDSEATYSFACLIAPAPPALNLPDAQEYDDARGRAMEATIPPVDYFGEVASAWVDYATLAARAGPMTLVERRLHLILMQQTLLDRLAPKGAPRYQTSYSAYAAAQAKLAAPPGAPIPPSPVRPPPVHSASAPALAGRYPNNSRRSRRGRTRGARRGKPSSRSAPPAAG